MKLNSTVAPICEVFPAPDGFEFSGRVLLHDCLSIPGRSGAPLLVGADGRDVLVGVNLGWLYETNAERRTVGYLRLIDQEITDALLQAAR